MSGIKTALMWYLVILAVVIVAVAFAWVVAAATGHA